MLTVEAIPLLEDNYAWWLRDEATGATAVVDAAVPGPVMDHVRARGGRLDWLWITHHHGDHVAGIPEVAAETGAKVAGNAADAHRLPKLDLVFRPGEAITLGERRATVMDTPGHTRGHVSLHVADGNALFCGDTLFVLGCGRLLEGSAEEMFASLRAIAALPDDTRAFCGHEYTLSNIRYARHLRPDDAALAEFERECQDKRARGEPTVPTTIGREKALNPFLRATDAAEFARLRAGKDSFR